MPAPVTPNCPPPTSLPPLRAFLRGRHLAANANDGLTVIVDDFRPGIDSADRFCRVRVSFPADDPDGQNFTLELTNAPFDDRITRIVTNGTRRGTCEPCPEGANLTLSLSLRDIKGVKSLARSLNSLFRRYKQAGQRYPNPNWKWSCPKTVATLHALAGHLEEYKLLRMATRPAPGASLPFTPSGGAASSARCLADRKAPAGRVASGSPVSPTSSPEPDLFDLLRELPAS